MAEWITDRLPTRADANRLENVKIKTYFGQSPENGFDCHYSCIVPGQLWWSPNAAANQAAEPTPASSRPEPFVVKHYSADERPSIKGNGFDGLEIGENRKEAEEFISWVNAHLSRSAPATVERKVRKVDQIAVLPESENHHPVVFALCSDNTILGLPFKGPIFTSEDWCQLPPIPQPEAE
jgi:hypothetical protein